MNSSKGLVDFPLQNHIGSWLGLLWLAVFVLYIQCFQIYPEERAMQLLFGEAYRDYCSRVRRWL